MRASLPADARDALSWVDSSAREGDKTAERHLFTRFAAGGRLVGGAVAEKEALDEG